MLLAVLIAAMAAMSASMLGIGQRSMLLPFLSIAAAGSSFIFTDCLGWFRLNRFVANGAMLLAAFVSLNHFLESDSQRQLLAIASLLVYVQIVLLFREKNRRISSQLMMFSLLQVVVASLLSGGIEFGFLLGLYSILALFALSVFFVQRETSGLGERPVAHRSKNGPASRPEKDDHSLLGGPPVAFVGNAPLDGYRSTMRRPFSAPILAMVFASWTFSTVFFYTTPRTGDGGWQHGLGARNVVGFSPEISFDRMGRVLQSEARVMRVSFSNAKTSAPYTLVGEPYFRGTVLAKYLSADGHGQWRQEIETTTSSGLALASPPSVRDLVRQDVLLEPTGGQLLFSVFPAYSFAETPSDIRIAPRSRQLQRFGISARDLSDEYRFCVATTGFRFGQQIEVTPHVNHLLTERDQARMELLKRRLRYIDSRQEFPRLLELAEEIVRTEAPDGSTYDRAKALERFFLEEDRFQYSLDLQLVQQKRRPSVDPIEDFVANHRTGHCEYFASALTLMLRSQGIPTRMVIGYKGGEYNFVGNYYLVRQRDAHAWVEAYLPADEVPPDTLYAAERHAGGGWLRLDPTPATTRESGSQRNLFDRATMSFDYVRWLWNDYVSRLTPTRQQDSVLAPLALDQKLPVSSLFDAKKWKMLLDRLTGASWQDLWRQGFRWQAGLVAFVTCFILYVGYRTLRSWLPRLRIRWRSQSKSRRGRRDSSVAFYVRLERLLRRWGIRRDPNQTQREFAAVAAAQLSRRQLDTPGDLPEEIVQAFYRVRFGHVSLSTSQHAHIEELLEHLARQPK